MLDDVDTGGGGQLVLGVQPRLAVLLDLVLLVKLHIQLFSPVISQFSQIGAVILDIPRAVRAVFPNSSDLSLEGHRVELVGDLGLENGVTGDGGRHVLSLLLRLGVLLNSVLLVSLHVNFVLDNIYPQ